MKIRQGFVSNSSSSSFILIDHAFSVSDEKYKRDFENFRSWLSEHVYWSSERQAFFFRYVPDSEFGWEQTLYNEWWEKFDFMLLQVKLTGRSDEEYGKHHETLLAWFQQFDPSIKYIIIPEEYTDDDSGVEYHIGYIDHQSVGDENLSMLESVDTINKFIFSEKSYILNGNDNSDRRWDTSGDTPVLKDYDDIDWGAQKRC